MSENIIRRRHIINHGGPNLDQNLSRVKLTDEEIEQFIEKLRTKTVFDTTMSRVRKFFVCALAYL